MKKIVVALLVIALVAMGAFSLVGCEKSLEGTYVSQRNPADTIVISGDTIESRWTTGGKIESSETETFTREKDVLTTTSDKEYWKKITVTKEGNLTRESKTLGGESITVTYTRLAKKKPKA